MRCNLCGSVQEGECTYSHSSILQPMDETCKWRIMSRRAGLASVLVVLDTTDTEDAAKRLSLHYMKEYGHDYATWYEEILQ